MLAIIAAVLLLLWLLGFTAFHAGALVHLLLVVGLLFLLFHVLWGGSAYE